MTDDLITRLESADGPSRELDAMIQHRITSGVGCGAAQDAPRYTASIDAALTLVPEGWTYEGRQGPSGFPHMWTLSTIKCGDVRYTTATGRARFAALALAAAALKARGV